MGQVRIICLHYRYKFLIVVVMYISRASWPSPNGKIYTSIYLRQSYRDGPRVRKRNIANLTHCDRQEIAAIELALRFKGDLTVLGSLDPVQLSQGLSVGAVWTVYEVARRLGMVQALGADFSGQLALWQVVARARARLALVGGTFGER